METTALLLKEPRQLDLAALRLIDPAEGDVVVETRWSGISTGTERLFWLGTMPPFPGMGYPLVPGYETVGEVVEAGPDADHRPGDFVFVPGARCYSDARALFGGSASRLVVSAVKAVTVDRELKEDAALMALAATAYHAMAGSFGRQPMLIVGHGVLGRLLARLASLLGGEPPVVWERDPRRRDGAEGYAVIDPAEDERRDYQTVFDVSGDASLLDTLIARLCPGGEVVLAGFYSKPLAFAFPQAFMKEARLRVAAEWQESDLLAVRGLVESGRLSLSGLITHRSPAAEAPNAYAQAFDDAACLKMVLDWKVA